MKTLTFGLTAAVLLLGGLACRRSDTPEKVSVRLPIPVVDTAFSPYYLAVDRGYFAQRGLAVTLELGSPELNPVKMVAQGLDRVGVLGGPELLLTARAQGKPLVAIAQIHKDSDFVVLLTKKASGLTDVKQLEGLEVGFFYGHISTDILRMLFKKMGVNVKEADVGFDYGRFIADKLKAQWAFRTTAGINLPAKGVEVNFISPRQYGIHTQGHVVVTTEEMINQHPEIVQRFVDAVLDGLALSVQNIDDAVSAAMKRDQAFSREVGLKQMAIYKETILRNPKLGWITLEDMKRTKEQMVSIGLVPESLNVSAAFTTRFLEQYYAARKN